MSEITKQIKRVQRWVDKRKRIKFRLAVKAGLSANALRHVDRPDWNPTVATLNKVLEAMRKIEAEESEEKQCAA